MADLLDKQVHTPAGDTPLVPVLLMAAGAYLCWFGVHYWRSDTQWPTDPLKAVMTGKPLPVPDRTADERALAAIGGAAAGAGAAVGAAGGIAAGAAAGGGSNQAPGGAGGSDIAAQALTYVGSGYVFGGPADRPGNWDCSSFTSYVLGHDLHLPLPGGRWGDPGFPPHAHGPTTGQYMLFGTPVAAGSERAGDLVVSSEHMGVVLTGGHYVSARTPALGVGVSSYRSSFPGGTPVFRRVAGGVLGVAT